MIWKERAKSGRKPTKAIAFGLTVSMMVAMLSGCSYGISNAITTVSESEVAKQDIEHLVNVKDESRSVGSLSDPSAVQDRLSAMEVDSFAVNWVEDTTYHFAWKIQSMVNTVEISVFAYTSDKENSVRIGFLPNAETTGETDFDGNGLPDGRYHVYVELRNEHGANETYEIRKLLTVGDKSDVDDGTVTGIHYTVETNAVSVSWEDRGAYKYRVLLLQPDSETVLSESTTAGTTARLLVPSDIKKARLVVATFDDNIMGPYTPIEIDVNTWLTN